MAILGLTADFVGVILIAFSFRISGTPDAVMETEKGDRLFGIVDASHPWMLRLGWGLMGLGFFLQLLAQVVKSN